MQTLDSLPPLRPGQVESMSREAEKRMKADGIIPEEPKVQADPPLEKAQAQSTFNESSTQSPSDSPEPLESPEQPATPEPVSQEAQTSNPAPRESFRSLREKAERAERERDEALKFVKEMQSRKQESAPVQQDEPDIDLNISDEDLVEGKHLNKIKQELQKLRQESRQRQQQSTELAVEAKLKSQYPDFDKIVSIDNLKDLSFAFPELANSIHANPDMYSKAVAAYTAIKKLGISQEDTLVADKDRALKNAAKPRPLASVSPQQGDSPLSKANAFAHGLTDDLKVQLRREMEAARRNM